MKTQSKILNQYFDFKAKHIYLAVEGEYLQDSWLITINGEHFDYSQGIGFRKAKPLQNEYFERYIRANPKKDKENLLRYAENLERVSTPQKPNLDDVLFSLLMDYTAGNDIFDDFCYNFGYSNDSIKATNIYKACQENSIKIRNVFSKYKITINKALEAFEQY